jgi:hypothetical protein
MAATDCCALRRYFWPTCYGIAVSAGHLPKAYEKAGFRVIGTRRQSGYWLGEPCDDILTDAIKDDFPGPSTVRRMAGLD